MQQIEELKETIRGCAQCLGYENMNEVREARLKKEAEQRQAAELIENSKTRSLPEKPQSLIPSRTKKFSKQRKTLMPNRLIPYKYEDNTEADFSLSEISNAISRKCNISDYPDNVKDFGSNEENQKSQKIQSILSLLCEIEPVFSLIVLKITTRTSSCIETANRPMTS